MPGSGEKLSKLLHARKPEGAIHCGTSTLAARLETDHKVVSQIWQDNGLKPHSVKTFKVRNDANFEEKDEWVQ